MKISIITVCWNSEKYLKTAIESILNQSYNNIEYIIIDGGSTDNTLNIIKSYEPLFEGRMRWISEKDNGIYDAMNKGLTMATGDILGLLNSDDFYISQNSIEKIVNGFITNKVDSVFADLYYVKEQDTDKIVRKWKTGNRKSFIKGWHPAHPCFFVKKEIYEKYGLFDLKYKIAADFEIMLRFLEKNKISSFYLEEFILKMRLGGESNKNFSNIKKGKKEILDAFQKHNIKIPFYYSYKRWISKAIQHL
ncbi:family 2 glycosyl transferase [Chryseobacterium piperi]|uniref:Family 2 glycosyl transferase n=1 Tax=Chryseobacterium piperi TaxID=558152 RepID=A0A086BKC8_9FLAO|nr:glycosyltransferase family 2 protein [Chryseobacterium piperi]ASW76168.1 glycosyltransferase [Chryseobacterium piperi]KFF29392.1 family 2 glycosyl transferase [Chryseobacterium piperi]